MKVDVRGKIVLVRYGRIFGGSKRSSRKSTVLRA